MKLKEVLIWLCVLVGVVGVGEVAVQAVVTTTAPRNDYTGTGATATYSYTFRIFDATDLLVIQSDVAGNVSTLTYPASYTVTGVNKAAGGTITLTAGVLGSGEHLAIKFNRTPRQSTDLRNQGSFLAETHESKFDELTRYIQALEEKVSRSLKQPDQETGTAALTILPASRASKFLAFDASNNPIAAAGTSADLGPVSSFINTLLDDTTAAGARTTLGAVGLTGNETVAGVKTFSSLPILSGGGVSFPATQVASADANTLDDYEEGNWTPSIGGTATYTTQTGRYTKIGRVVYINCTLTINTRGTGSQTTVTGLPFTSASGVVGSGAASFATAATSIYYLMAQVNGGGTSISFPAQTASDVSTGLPNIFTNGTSVSFSLFYII